MEKVPGSAAKDKRKNKRYVGKEQKMNKIKKHFSVFLAPP